MANRSSFTSISLARVRMTLASSTLEKRRKHFVSITFLPVSTPNPKQLSLLEMAPIYVLSNTAAFLLDPAEEEAHYLFLDSFNYIFNFSSRLKLLQQSEVFNLVM